MKIDERMKTYENVSKNELIRRIPVIMRLDGKAFHSYTKGMQKPFDEKLNQIMSETTQFLCAEIQGAKFAYHQSDEISILILDYDQKEWKKDITPWFGYKIQKMASISASLATAKFNREAHKQGIKPDKLAFFDSRIFNLPETEVNNYFYWRQLDATRNAIQGLGQKHFSHKELQKKNCNLIQDMLFTQKGINFNDLPIIQKRGTGIVKNNFEMNNAIRSKWVADTEIPIFSQDTNYIEKYLKEGN